MTTFICWAATMSAFTWIFYVLGKIAGQRSDGYVRMLEADHALLIDDVWHMRPDGGPLTVGMVKWFEGYKKRCEPEMLEFLRTRRGGQFQRQER